MHVLKIESMEIALENKYKNLEIALENNYKIILTSGALKEVKIFLYNNSDINSRFSISRKYSNTFHGML